MADGTKIEWTDATWNIVNGCSVTSPGCTNCYAMRLAGTRLKHVASREGLTAMSKAGPVWTGETRFNEPVLLDPIRWKRPRRIFVCAHGDLFHESVPDAWIDRVFAVMALAPQHQFQVLTKRAERMRQYASDPKTPGRIARAILDIVIDRVVSFREPWPVETIGDIDDPDDVTIAWPLPNVWLGTSVEDQKRADERIPHLLATPAAVRWLSCEPLLGPVDLEQAWHGENALDSECWGECNWCRNGPDFPPLHNCQSNCQSDADAEKGRSGLDWIIVGGESGSGARPMHPDWARSLRDQCQAAGVPFLFKQWGNYRPYDPIIDDYTKNDPTGEYGENGACHVLNDGEESGPENIMIPVGKKAAGRLLDGVQHDGFPS